MTVTATAPTRAAADLAAAHTAMREAAGRTDAAAYTAAEQTAIRARAAVLGLPADVRPASAGIMPVSEAQDALMSIINLDAWALAASKTLPAAWRSPGGADASYVLALIAEERAVATREYAATLDLPGVMGRLTASTRVVEAAATVRRLSDYLTGGRVYA